MQSASQSREHCSACDRHGRGARCDLSHLAADPRRVSQVTGRMTSATTCTACPSARARRNRCASRPADSVDATPMDSTALRTLFLGRTAPAATRPVGPERALRDERAGASGNDVTVNGRRQCVVRSVIAAVRAPRGGGSSGSRRPCCWSLLSRVARHGAAIRACLTRACPRAGRGSHGRRRAWAPSRRPRIRRRGS